ncbi:MAG: protein translocase SEC61 complex subunit gamma [Candidatus Aenigmarchaeota archaeon]|nr:protein translocase SEC61 complex subunit gamma [Candidatus Aenigmarchaeota archaeon]MDI6722413.1 protein translocase SEC61 complex subunit gamma [Candidatus Aenigmarchaeota archaeon]
MKEIFERIRRILLVSTKPDKSEYKQSAKITGLGFVVIGIIGFVIFIIFNLIGGV